MPIHFSIERLQGSLKDRRPNSEVSTASSRILKDDQWHPEPRVASMPRMSEEEWR